MPGQRPDGAATPLGVSDATAAARHPPLSLPSEVQHHHSIRDLEPSAPPPDPDDPLVDLPLAELAIQPLGRVHGTSLPCVPPLPSGQPNVGRTPTKGAHLTRQPPPLARSFTLPSSGVRRARFPPRPLVSKSLSAPPPSTSDLTSSATCDSLPFDVSIMVGTFTRRPSEPSANTPPPALSRPTAYHAASTSSLPTYLSAPVPPFVSHNSEGTHQRNQSRSHSGSFLPPPPPFRQARSSGQLPQAPISNAPPNHTERYPARRATSGPYQQQPPILTHQQVSVPFEAEDLALAEALRESKEAAELEQARQASARAENERLLRLTIAQSSYMAEQEERLEREAVAESMRLSRESKGKQRARESSQERREQEEIDFAIALSLSQPERQSESARKFAQLSQPAVNPHSRSHSPTSPLLGAFIVANPDPDEVEEEPLPPAYERPDEQEIAENPRTVVLGPGHPLPQPSASPLDLPAATTLPPSSSSNLRSSTYFPAHAPRPPSRLPQLPPRPFPPISRADTGAPSSVALSYPNDTEDPFDEATAAVTDYAPAPVAVSWDTSSDEEADEENGIIRLERHGNNFVALPPQTVVNANLFERVRSREGDSPTLGAEPHSLPSDSSLCPPSRPLAITPRSSPLFGGFVDFSGANPIADESLLQGVSFGFVPQGPRGARRAPLAHSGGFPDVAQLSRLGGLEGDSQEYVSFAVEASSWQSLLVYLMWHGNSHLEAAPRDLQREKTEAGLSCAISVEFFRDENQATRVRCRIDLLPPMHRYDPINEEASSSSYSSLAVDQPSVTVHLPDAPLLPVLLSTVATTLSAAHTVSREKALPGRHGSASGAHKRLLRDLALAVDLFKRINGEEVVEDVEEVVDDEKTLISKWKSLLKKRKKGPRLVKGGADGTGGGRPLEASGPLPEAAMLIAPFMLEP